MLSVVSADAHRYILRHVLFASFTPVCESQWSFHSSRIYHHFQTCAAVNLKDPRHKSRSLRMPSLPLCPKHVQQHSFFLSNSNSYTNKNGGNPYGGQVSPPEISHCLIPSRRNPTAKRTVDPAQQHGITEYKNKRTCIARMLQVAIYATRHQMIWFCKGERKIRSERPI